MGVSPPMILKYVCHTHWRAVVQAGPRVAPLRMRGTRPMMLSGGCAGCIALHCISDLRRNLRTQAGPILRDTHMHGGCSGLPEAELYARGQNTTHRHPWLRAASHLGLACNCRG